MAELQILQIYDTCTGCGACVSVCPKKCLSLERNSEGFYYPKCDESICVNCRLCEKCCHVLSDGEVETVGKDNFYMFADKDSVRASSSSGGAFFRLAQHTLSHGGVVFGSAFNPKTTTLEIFSTDEMDLNLMQKSKYVESYASKAFSMVSMELKARRKVLFCGTPCQVRGLRQFLKVVRADDTNLITVDFICHGVPSSKCLDEYLRRFNKRHKHVINVDFRNKRFCKKGQGWHDLSLRLDFNDGSQKVIPYEPPYYLNYYKLFEDSVILRKCCYSCSLPEHSQADFTLADFWGIYKYRPSIDDNKGVSIIKMHTEKALRYWEQIEIDNQQFEPLPYDAVKYIYKKTEKTKQLKQRDDFFRNYETERYEIAVRRYYGFKKLLKAYTIGYLRTKIKMIIKKF